MSSDIYAKPDFSKKVRYNRKVQEDSDEREEKQVVIYERVEGTGDYHAALESQEGGPPSQKDPPVQRRRFRAAKLFLGVLFLLMAAGNVILSIRYFSVTLEKGHLQTRYDNLQSRYNNLQTRYDNLQTRYNELQNETKQLRDKTTVKCPDGWQRFGCSCYFKSTEKKSWYESRRYCQNSGADLVIINSKEEQEFVTKLNMNEESWIGLKKEWNGIKYQWEWVDGSPLTEPFWATGQGNVISSSYAVFCDEHGKWKTAAYSNPKNWICEKCPAFIAESCHVFTDK